MKKINTGSSKGGRKRGVPSRRLLYQKIAGKADFIIRRLVELSKSKNDSVAVSACRILLERVVPSLKTMEIQDHVQEPVVIEIVKEDSRVHKET